MNAIWCNVRRCWIVTDPANPGSILAVGASKEGAELDAEVRARKERTWCALTAVDSRQDKPGPPSCP